VILIGIAGLLVLQLLIDRVLRMLNRHGVGGTVLIVAVLVCAVMLAAVLVPARRFPDLTADDLGGVDDVGRRIELAHERAKLRNDVRAGLLQPVTLVTVLATIAFTWLQFDEDRVQRSAQTQEFSE